MEDIKREIFKKPLTKINFPKHEEKKLSLYTHEIHGKSEKQFSEHMKRKERSIKQMVRNQVHKPCPKKEVFKVDQELLPKRKINPIPEKIVKIDNDLPRRTVVKPHKWPSKTNDKQLLLNHSQTSILDQKAMDEKNALLEGILKDMKVTEVPGCRLTNNNNKEALGTIKNLNQRSNPQKDCTKFEKNSGKKIASSPCLEKAKNKVLEKINDESNCETSHKEKSKTEALNTISHHKFLENKVNDETKKAVIGDSTKKINSNFEYKFEPKVQNTTNQHKELKKKDCNVEVTSDEVKISTVNLDTKRQDNPNSESKVKVENKSTENEILSDKDSKIQVNVSSPPVEAGSRLRRSKRRLNHQVCYIFNDILSAAGFLLQCII